MKLYFYITRRHIEEEKLEIFSGCHSNPNFKVVFIAISTNKQARRLVWFGQFLTPLSLVGPWISQWRGSECWVQALRLVRQD